jgi:hypothetical protein
MATVLVRGVVMLHLTITHIPELPILSHLTAVCLVSRDIIS